MTGRELPNHSRGRDIHEAHRAATPLELLFDLTFVVAIALAASQLHHGVVEHHTLQTLPGYFLAFFAIWWAWVNYTWFASAYDNDDTLYRALTMVQMGGVLVLATGIPGLFEGDILAAIVGYVVMRVALGIQWLRAAHGDPQRRATCIRYAIGIFLVQILWIGLYFASSRHLLPAGGFWPTTAAIALCELAVPVYAERAGTTPWHAHHIAERYGLMVIIVLGECVLGATNALSKMLQVHGWSFDFALLGFAGALLIFVLWWMYFLLPSADALHHHRERAWGWGYGHYVLFAAVAAIGAGLEVVADVVGAEHAAVGAHDGADLRGATAPGTHGVSALYAVTMVAIAQAIFVASLWALHRYVARTKDRQLALVLVCLAGIALGPLAVANGVPLPWGLLLLSSGPLVAIAYNEHGRRRRADRFAVT